MNFDLRERFCTTHVARNVRAVARDFDVRRRRFSIRNFAYFPNSFRFLTNMSSPPENLPHLWREAQIAISSTRESFCDAPT